MTVTAAPKPSHTRSLSIMMFLQYAIWGSWLPILYPFLMGHRAYSLEDCGWILAVGAVGAVLGPFVAGQLADRWFNTERFLGLSHLLGAAVVWFLADVADFNLFLVLTLLYSLVYSPTLALTNSLCFHHLTDRDKQFGPIRLWGAIGWIAAGIAMGHWLRIQHTPDGVAEAVVEAAQNAGRADAFRLSAILGVVMGLYCFTLPATPPSRDASERFATGKALKAIRRQPLITLFLLAIPVSCIHQFYFIFTSDFLSSYGRDAANSINNVLGVGGGGLMTIGQMSEILVLALIPLFAKRVSRKTLLAIGLCAYAARMALFAYTNHQVLILLGVSLHGLCFGCFIFVAFMVVDEETSPDIRASAQNLFFLVIVGIGIGVGSFVATQIGEAYTITPQNIDLPGLFGFEIPGVDITIALPKMDYPGLFKVPMWASLACLLVLLAVYPGGRKQQATGAAS